VFCDLKSLDFIIKIIIFGTKFLKIQFLDQ